MILHFTLNVYFNTFLCELKDKSLYNKTKREYILKSKYEFIIF